MSNSPNDAPRIVDARESEFRHDVWNLHVKCARATWTMTRRQLLTAIKTIANSHCRTATDVIDAMNEAEVAFELAASRFVRSSMSAEELTRAFGGADR